MRQIKLNLPTELYLLIRCKAEMYGLDLTSYIRHLIANDHKDVNVPVFEMSDKTERKGLKALREHDEGKTTEIKDIKKYFDRF